MENNSATEAWPLYFRIADESHSKRSRLSGVLGSKYPELRNDNAPNRFNFRQTSTRLLAWLAGSVNSSNNHSGLPSFGTARPCGISITVG